MDPSTKKVLIADDSNIALAIQEATLKRTPYQLIVARDGQEAVEKAIAESPDLILMDVMMPRMNGFEAVRTLRKRDETAQTPIIMVTTKGEDEKVAEGYAAGCNDYVTKPIDPVLLYSKIKNLI